MTSQFPVPSTNPPPGRAARRKRKGRHWASACGALTLSLAFLPGSSRADEQLLGYVRGTEPLPKGAWELEQNVTHRADKGTGHYAAWNGSTEVEHGFSERVTGSIALRSQSLSTDGLIIDGYLPKEESTGLQLSGAELEMKYNILKPALHPLGLSLLYGLSYDTIDPHSGQDKETLSGEVELALQKYFQDGRVVLMGNVGVEATHAERGFIAGLPADLEWTTDPEVEIELKLGVGLAGRVGQGWFLGIEALYETEFETEVGQERWSVFVGPSVHHASKRWWVTLTWLPQVRGGGETYDGQPDDLHLIEKTKWEARLKFGWNF